MGKKHHPLQNDRYSPTPGPDAYKVRTEPGANEKKYSMSYKIPDMP